jgi:hypothetical protein
MCLLGKYEPACPKFGFGSHYTAQDWFSIQLASALLLSAASLKLRTGEGEENFGGQRLFLQVWELTACGALKL